MNMNNTDHTMMSGSREVGFMNMNNTDHTMMSGSNIGTRSVGAKCGHWNPTAGHVKVLTELFSSGLRTPTTEQIQTISSHLSSFGKIESKNVFYWFQNHKARERHHKKRRRGGGGDLCSSKVPDQYKKEARTWHVNKHLDSMLQPLVETSFDVQYFPKVLLQAIEKTDLQKRWYAQNV